MAYPSITLTKCKDNQIPNYSSKYSDGNRPLITSVSGPVTEGSTLTLNGVFSAKRNGTMWSSVPVLGNSMAPGYVYQNAVPGFNTPMAALADAVEGTTWSGVPSVYHDYTEESFYAYYVKFEIVKTGNEAPTWDALNLYVNGDAVSYDPGSPGFLRRYVRINTSVAVATPTAPNLDPTNWRSNSDDWQDLQIKMERPNVDVVHPDSHSGGIFTTILFTSNQVPPSGAIIGGRILSNYQGEADTGGSRCQEFNNADVSKIFTDWVLVVGHYKACDVANNPNGSVYKIFKNENLKQLAFQHIDGDEGNSNYNDRRLTGNVTEFFEPRYVVKNRYVIAENAGVYAPRSNRFTFPFFKRESTHLKTYICQPLINDSPEFVWLMNGSNINTAFKTGKAIPQRQISRTTSQVSFEVFMGDLVNADTIYAVVQNSNGKFSVPYKVRDPI